ncbi:hypothetical protein LTR37_016756 [Vermiconidia calcicola]|uniref:Uncharacterized protein n=1 Tax=Vermiconidia calcicola TaxID=1690605 RepID=A0ACC3MPP0_9PEZI|nr:hypothetical protein LTR37_016756 [Vermiconidia calcicola]
MSFHFQPQADSSEDEEQVDLATWQTGAAQKQKSPINAAAVDVGEEEADEEDKDEEQLSAFMDPASNDDVQAADSGANEEEDADEDEEEPQVGEDFLVLSDNDEVIELDSPRDASAKPGRKRQSLPFVSPGFTSINAPVQISSGEDESESQDEEIEVSRNGRKVVVPIVPRIQLDSEEEEEIEDFTKGGDVVRKVLKETKEGRRGVKYTVEFGDWHVEAIPFEELLQYKNGQRALDDFESQPPPSKPSRRSRMSSTRPGRRSAARPGFVNTVDAVSDDEAVSEDDAGTSRTRGRKRKQAVQSQYVDNPQSESDADELGESDEETRPRKRGRRQADPGASRSLRSARHPMYRDELQDEDEDESDELPFLDSDLPGAQTRKLTLRGPKGPGRPRLAEDGGDYEKSKRHREGERQSGRTTRHIGGMAEVGENEIFRSSSSEDTRAPVKQKVVAVREQFKTLPRNDEFRMRHTQDCETCGQGANFAQLVYCQGCTLAYHKSCLGPRNSREHLVTKVGEGDSVLQCRRCIAYPRKKDPTAPDQGKCADCHEHGNACFPFRSRKSTAQEQKEREDNGGEDPTYEIDPSRVNQAENVLFRCINCWRGFHFEHLPSRSDLLDMDAEVDAEQRFREYSRDWRCKDCVNMLAKVSGLIAWKPMDEDNYDPGLAFDAIDEDEKAYLVRWEGMSYFRACWMPGAWVWGVTAHSMRKAFAKRDDSQHPKMRTEDAIPEDYLRTDIVLDIKYTSIVDIRTEEIDKARIREIDKALIKYKGLGYEDAVWEAPPSPEDGDRWTDFVLAYNDWVLGRYVRVPKPSTMKSRLDKARHQDFAKLEKKTQPENVEGGELMHYQIEGLNWLYYKWFTQKNAILADEMGLGKTIQIIGFLATLVADWNCFPFLVVVPNSTCPNWRREIKRWAPSLRVVAYYGSKESRDLAYRYELFPEGSKDLRCHIVVTSYDAASDENCRKFFKNVNWQGLIVDEGQRLKNENSLLYAALGALKAPFRILLTGTPLQNNQRELFNLLHFLDESYSAAELEKEYADLDAEKIAQLHDIIRPFFLRRTKAQVLTFLPPMAQIIVPVSMTIVQKKVYRTILAKNTDLMKAIFSSEATLGKTERASLSNILMQLRKCLCHPFVYNKSIEERNVSNTMSHRNLVDASSKVKLLELLLPKLKERGHRVLIFSQFLDMLDIVEDFMDGMELKYQRLDGSVSSLQKQKRIDEFNAPDSPLFAFLLSTRAGGVGINLASADTVIILDPDFNPHQDIQALSRAHRIGQHKKVLCFQLVTRASAEERIMQMGRKKLALDHVLIQEMDADDDEQTDLVSVLRHGANELFEDSGDQDILYDGYSVDRLLDRSHMEDTKSGDDKSAETQFSFARVWANDQGALKEAVVDEQQEQQAPDPGVWANILRERERVAAEEAAAKAEAYGRGRRARGNVDYNNELEGAEGLDITPANTKKVRNTDESDTDFQADGSEPEDEDGFEGKQDNLELEDVLVVGDGAKRDAGRKTTGKHAISSSTNNIKGALPTPAATPKKTVLPTLKAKMASSTKPKAAPKGSSEIVKKPNGAAGKTLQGAKKSRAVPKASASAMKKPGAAMDKVMAQTSDKKASASFVKKPSVKTSAEHNGSAGSQFNTAGSPSDPIVLDDSEDEKSVDAVETQTQPQHPLPSTDTTNVQTS